MKKTAIALSLIMMTTPITSAWADYEETRDVDAFTRVHFDGLMEVTIEVGEEQSVTLSASKERYLRDTTTHVRNGRLIIETDYTGFFIPFRDIDMSVHITVPSLESVKLEGVGDLVITNLDADDFRLELDGIGNIEIDGTCNSAEFTLDGMGNLDARELKCKSVRLSMDGMGGADIYASEYADVSIDGMGSADVYGNPEKSRYSEDGMGSIEEK